MLKFTSEPSATVVKMAPDGAWAAAGSAGSTMPIIITDSARNSLSRFGLRMELPGVIHLDECRGGRWTSPPGGGVPEQRQRPPAARGRQAPQAGRSARSDALANKSPFFGTRCLRNRSGRLQGRLNLRRDTQVRD